MRDARRGLKGRVEAAQAQDLDLNWNREREEEWGGRRAGGNAEASRQPVQTQLWDSEPLSSSSQEQQPAHDPGSRAGEQHPAQRDFDPQAGQRSREELPPRALGDFDPRGMSAKEIALQKELRVGQGPVCWPKGVSQEVIERDRLRQLARAKSL